MYEIDTNLTSYVSPKCVRIAVTVGSKWRKVVWIYCYFVGIFGYVIMPIRSTVILKIIDSYAIFFEGQAAWYPLLHLLELRDNGKGVSPALASRLTSDIGTMAVVAGVEVGFFTCFPDYTTWVPISPNNQYLYYAPTYPKVKPVLAT